MNAPGQPLSAAGGAPARVAGMRIFVRGLRIEARIGVYDHELNRRQPLLIDAELEVCADGAEVLDQTVDYETVLRAAEALAQEGHVSLVETFAERLARACMADPRVTRVRVRIEKPEALAPKACAAGVEIVLERP